MNQDIGMERKAGALADIRLQVIWSRLIAVVEEQAQTLIRTAFGAATREAGDLSAGVFLPDGRMVAQAVTGTPGHVNTMAEAVKHFLDVFPAGTMTPGDVYITNDPWKASGHLHDLTVVTPAFRSGRLTALLASTIHVVDIGGLGLGVDSTEIYHEGLYIPIMKLVDAGRLNDTLFQMVRANVREPVQVEGDVHALIAAGEIGARRLLQTMDEFEIETLQEIGRTIIETSRRAMIEAIAAWPRGSFENVMTIDGLDREVRLAMRLTIAGDEILVDYAGTSPLSPFGINVPKTYTDAYTTFGVRCIIGPEVPNNAGSLSVIRVVAPEGCILNAPHPRAVVSRSVIGQMLPDVVFGCLHRARPGAAPAEGSSSLWNVRLAGGQVVRGIDPSDVAGATRFNVTTFSTGGTGARPAGDGLSATSFPAGVQSVSVEVLEAVSPLLFWRKELRPDSGGAGRHRGGCGQIIEVANSEDAPMVLSATFDRIVHAARGRDGGGDGAPGRLGLSSGRAIAGKGRQVVAAGERLIVETPGGGGLGLACMRDPAALARDLGDGLVSRAGARASYAQLEEEVADSDRRMAGSRETSDLLYQQGGTS